MISTAIVSREPIIAGAGHFYVANAVTISEPLVAQNQSSAGAITAPASGRKRSHDVTAAAPAGLRAASVLAVAIPA